MPAITVTNTLHDSGGKPVVGAACPIVLIGAAAFDAGNIEIVGQAGTVTTDSTGTWTTTTLTPNSQLTPTGTYYMVYEPNASHAFTVPATGGPYMLNQLLVSSPTSPAASLGIVRYDVAQPLTPAQQAQAQQNIGTVAGGVTSFNARTGAVVPQSGDYTAAQVGADASGAAAAEQTRALAAEALLIPLSQKAAANGVATLDSGGKVPVAQLPASVMEYQGTWNATTNTPMLADGTGRAGDIWRVAAAGSHDFGHGAISFQIGDNAIYDGTKWQRASAPDGVSSVAGRIGDVTLTEADVSGLTADLAARALVMVPTATKTSAYTAAVNDLVLCDATTAPFAVTLPTAPADKSILEVKKLDASANTVTITCGGSDTFAIGGTTLVLALQGHAARLQYQSSTSKWIALDNDLPLVATDARYVGKSTVTTKGDLLVATGSGAVARHGVGSDGQVLTADSTQADGVKWAAAAGGTLVGSGPAFMLAGTGTPTSLSPFGVVANASIFPGRSANTPGGLKVGISKTLTISSASISVTTAGAAGATARFGIYQVGSNGMPTTTVFDSGSVAVDTTGVKTVSTSLTLTPGDYWVISTCSDTTTRFHGWQAAANNYSNGASAFAGSGLGFIFGGTSAPPASALPSLSGATGTFLGNFGQDGAPTIQVIITGVS